MVITKKLVYKAWTDIKKDPVLIVAFIAALVSSFYVPPSSAYLGYIDLQVICLLLSLMLVVAGLQSVGVFGLVISRLLGFVHNTRALAAVLVGISFFF